VTGLALLGYNAPFSGCSNAGPFIRPTPDSLIHEQEKTRNAEQHHCAEQEGEARVSH
jgi:hypothetical protein